VDSTALTIVAQIPPEDRTQMLESMGSLVESKTMIAEHQLNIDNRTELMSRLTHYQTLIR
jgi:hypothetical protein